MHAYNPDSYVPEKLDEWIAIAKRQAPKDRILIPVIEKLFRPGPILELGSATGAIAQILQELGREVVTSDYAQFFVDYMRRRGLNAHRVDATNVEAFSLEEFPNIFCQSISPFITDDMNVVAKAYRSVYKALMPGGRFVLIHAMASRDNLRQTMKEHALQARNAGFTQVFLKREQLLPTVAYAQAPRISRILESLLGASLGSRFVLMGNKQ